MIIVSDSTPFISLAKIGQFTITQRPWLSVWNDFPRLSAHRIFLMSNVESRPHLFFIVSEFQCFLNNEIRDMPSVARLILLIYLLHHTSIPIF